MKKRFFGLLTAMVAMGSFLFAQEFNFAQELRNTYKIKNTLELIIAYHNLAAQVNVNDSTRLSKKLVRLIKNLHQVCYDNKQEKTQAAFKKLVDAAQANKKLQTVDYAKVLSKIAAQYEHVAEPKSTETAEGEEAGAPGEEPDEEPVAPTEAEVSAEEEPEVPAEPEALEPVDPKQATRERLKELAAGLQRNDIIYLLQLRRILNHIGHVKEDIDDMKQELSRISRTDLTVRQMYNRIARIEQALRPEQLVRSPGILLDDDAEINLDDCSSLLREMILEDEEEE